MMGPEHDMKERPSRFASMVKDFAQLERAAMQDHPSEEQLIGYHLGEVEPGDHFEQLQDHLSLCAECGRFIDELNGAAAAPADFSTSPEQKKVAWSRIREQIEIGEPSSASLTRVEAPGTFFSTQRFAYAVAALLLATAALVLVRPGAEKPGATTFPVDLAPRGSLTARGEHELVRVPHGVESVLLILHLDRPERFDTYTVTIRGGRGEARWSKEAVEADPRGYLNLSVPAKFLQDGRYEIRLTGHSGEKHEPAGEYSIEWRSE